MQFLFLLNIKNNDDDIYSTTICGAKPYATVYSGQCNKLELQLCIVVYNKSNGLYRDMSTANHSSSGRHRQCCTRLQGAETKRLT